MNKLYYPSVEPYDRVGDTVYRRFTVVRTGRRLWGWGRIVAIVDGHIAVDRWQFDPH